MFLGIAISLACVAAVVPIALSLRAAEQEVARREQEQLELFATAAVARMEMVMAEVTAALHEMEDLPDAPCSDGNLASLRRIAFSYRYLRDTGRYAGTYRLCSALLGDVFRRHMTLPEPDWRDGKGFEYWFDVDNPFGASRPAMLVGLNGQYVSIDPMSFVDIVELAARHIGAVNQATGVIFASTPGASLAQMESIFHRSSQGESDEFGIVRRSERIPFAAIVQAPHAQLLESWPMLVASIVLGGLVIGVLLAAVVLRIVSRRLTLEAALRNAVRRHQLEVHFQPIVALADGRCTGVEALLRWRRDGQMVPPDVLVTLAEQSGQMAAITDHVLERAVAELGPLLRARPDFYVSINVSAEDLRTPRFLEVLTARLPGTGIAPRQVRIEITERSFLHADVVRGVIQAFRDAGHPVYIDDFGTGYSSLSYLQVFKVDALKIDKSFIDTIGREAASSTVAPHIIAMAEALGFEVVAEGIEHEAQVRFLRERGAQYGQGWLFSRALPADALLRYLAQEAPAAALPPVHAD
ncbi:EAL domain-containing protein [Cupriavidus sp. NPDC089707]|uniref:EAL domain-containing protein n=1 Tax=Cupriavidus sp. NPDC089707 TaxID=3363963 RepID=UPI0037F6C014